MPRSAAILETLCSANAELAPVTSLPDASLGGGSADADLDKAGCFHCGTPCQDSEFAEDDKVFCCAGCRTVYELLMENGLAEFYQLGRGSEVKGEGVERQAQFRFVDEPAVRSKLVDFSNEFLTRVTFQIPAIHCIACVWLLENLFRLKAGIGRSEVNFPKKQVSISFDPGRVLLSEVISLLGSLGYAPELKLSDLEVRPRNAVSRRLWLQLGIAGFAFGNTMLFSIATYLGLDTASGPGFRRLVGFISLVLSLPVVTYSALDYWRSAWVSLRRGLLNIDVPIVVGISALFVQSSAAVLTGAGEGYFDSLAGLLFFLLCGKLFQQKTFDRLAFDRDYRSFFPLSVIRRRGSEEERVALSQLQVGDELIVRHGELIPADARLLEGTALIDYSFVTGEAESTPKLEGDHLYAGGRQMGGAIRVQTVKGVSQGYLTSLWNQGTFQKVEKGDTLHSLTNRYSQRFTKIVIGIALSAGACWAWANPAVSVRAFTSVLIVACPCALALAAPFALGTALRVLSRHGVFLKNTAVLERMATATGIVFDKTGTLTLGAGKVVFHGAPLEKEEAQWINSLARHSTHPSARRVVEASGKQCDALEVESFHEAAGCGIEGRVDGHRIRIGSAAWAGEEPNRGADPPAGSSTHVSINGQYRGCFAFTSQLRPKAEELIARLARSYELALLSGDNDKDRARLGPLFNGHTHLFFNQSPLDKLKFVRGWQEAGRSVVMVGDGLNDAGALKESGVGIAVVEEIGSFSPASDAIMAASMVPQLDRVLGFARSSVRVVRASFVVSAIYNAVGIGIAAMGLLSPVVCAILMPLSSITVVVVACGATSWLGRRRL